MIDPEYRQEIRDGRYVIVGAKDGYRIVERFGSYRILKKVFRTPESAIKRAEMLP